VKTSVGQKQMANARGSLKNVPLQIFELFSQKVSRKHRAFDDFRLNFAKMEMCERFSGKFVNIL
jgi:hypothetical protein